MIIALNVPLERVARLAEQIQEAEAALDLARGLMAEALYVALETERRADVARAAGITPSAMYKTLAKRYGPRKGAAK